MKSTLTKEKYILLRAEGKSQQMITKKLHVSKSNCSAWEKEFESAISEKKQEQLNHLYEMYYMKKNLRIQQLGKTLININSSLEKTDLIKIPPEKLLDFKLKYINALKNECTGKTLNFPESIDLKSLILFFQNLINHFKNGEICDNQISAQISILNSIFRILKQVEKSGPNDNRKYDSYNKLIDAISNISPK